MKRFTNNTRAIFILLPLFFITLFAGCKKDKDEDEGLCPDRSYGGVGGNHNYVFWVAKDYGCGQITVEVTDQDGNTWTAQKKITGFYANFPPDCNNPTNCAVGSAPIGWKYTYRAYCSGKEWKGTLPVECNSGCSLIELK